MYLEKIIYAHAIAFYISQNKIKQTKILFTFTLIEAKHEKIC
jgi:hypothetical protein